MNNPRIFILEDDASISSLLQDVLAQESWETCACSRTRDAMTAIRKFKPDILLFDVTLPDGDGFEICRQVRRDPALSQVPLIFMTSKGDIHSRLKGFEAGAQDYLIKPFDFRELIARVCAHLSIKREKDTIRHENEDLRLRERLREDMMGMIVHDLRSPLATIKVTLEMLQMKGFIRGIDYDVAVQNAENATEWAILMVNDLLDLNAGTLTVNQASLHLPGIIDRLRSMFRAQLEHRDIRLQADPPPENVHAKTDPILLLRILINLVSNAVKFSPPKGVIAVRSRFEDDKLLIEIADQGPGVPAPEKEKIFLKFYRARIPGYEMAPGNGIGLAFCKMAADALGGRIWVEDGPKGGSCFKLEIPVLSEVPA